MKRAMLTDRRARQMERRRFVEEPEKTISMLDALLLAVEALQEVGGEQMDQAARMLDRKAMKLRAREEASITYPELCLCGKTRPGHLRFCVACHSAIPLRLWMAYHTAPTAKLMGKTMEEICEFVRGLGRKGGGR